MFLPSRGVLVDVDVGMYVKDRAMAMWVRMEIAPLPAHQQTSGQRDDDYANEHFGRSLEGLGQEAAEENNGEPEYHERSSVPQSPAEPQQSSTSVTALILVQEQSGNSREVIRVSGMT
jgi:hypothetical protein